MQPKNKEKGQRKPSPLDQVHIFIGSFNQAFAIKESLGSAVDCNDADDVSGREFVVDLAPQVDRYGYPDPISFVTYILIGSPFADSSMKKCNTKCI